MDVNEADRTKTQRTIGGRLARSFLAVLASSLFVPVSCSAFAYGGFQALFLLEDRRAPLPWVLLEGPDGEVSLLSSEAEVQAATEDLVARSRLGDPGPTSNFHVLAGTWRSPKGPNSPGRCGTSMTVIRR